MSAAAQWYCRTDDECMREHGAFLLFFRSSMRIFLFLPKTQDPVTVQHTPWPLLVCYSYEFTLGRTASSGWTIWEPISLPRLFTSPSTVFRLQRKCRFDATTCLLVNQSQGSHSDWKTGGKPGKMGRHVHPVRRKVREFWTRLEKSGYNTMQPQPVYSEELR